MLHSPTLSFLGVLESLMYGIAPSSCPLPCTTFSTETKHTSDIGGYLGFGVTFQQTVEVIIFTQPKILLSNPTEDTKELLL